MTNSNSPQLSANLIEYVPWCGPGEKSKRAPTKSLSVKVVKAVNLWNQALDELSRDLHSFPVIGFGMEWLSKEKLELVMVERVSEGFNPQPDDVVVAENIARGKVAMIQLSSYTGFTILFRSCYFTELPRSLINLLQDPEIMKVGLGIHQAKLRLKIDWGATMAGYVDLRFLVKLMPEFQSENAPVRISMKAMAAHLFGRDAEWDKMRAKLSDWSSGWLHNDQVYYAAKSSQAAIDLFVWGLPSLLSVNGTSVWSNLERYARATLHFIRSRNFSDQDYKTGKTKKKRKFSKCSEGRHVFGCRCTAGEENGHFDCRNMCNDNFDSMNSSEFSDRFVNYRLSSQRTVLDRASDRIDNFVGFQESEYLKCHGLQAEQVVACLDQARLQALRNRSILTTNDRKTRKMILRMNKADSAELEMCVVCAKSYSCQHLVTYSIVPEGYRNHYDPPEYSYCSCNYCRICFDCLPLVHQFELKLRQVVAEVCGAELWGYPSIAIDERLRGLKQKAVWLKRFSQNDNIMSQEEVVDYLTEIFQYYGYAEHKFCDKELVNDLIEHTAKRSYLTFANEENLLVHERKAVLFFLTKHENKCAEAYTAFENMWRQIFVRSVNPKGFQKGWSTFHAIANCPAVADGLKHRAQTAHSARDQNLSTSVREPVQRQSALSIPNLLPPKAQKHEKTPDYVPVPAKSKSMTSIKPSNLPNPNSLRRAPFSGTGGYRVKNVNTLVPIVKPLVINLEEQSDEESECLDAPETMSVSDEDSELCESLDSSSNASVTSRTENLLPADSNLTSLSASVHGSALAKSAGVSPIMVNANTGIQSPVLHMQDAQPISDMVNNVNFFLGPQAAASYAETSSSSRHTPVSVVSSHSQEAQHVNYAQHHTLPRPTSTGTITRVENHPLYYVGADGVSDVDVHQYQHVRGVGVGYATAPRPGILRSNSDVGHAAALSSSGQFLYGGAAAKAQGLQSRGSVLLPTRALPDEPLPITSLREFTNVHNHFLRNSDGSAHRQPGQSETADTRNKAPLAQPPQPVVLRPPLLLNTNATPINLQQLYGSGAVNGPVAMVQQGTSEDGQTPGTPNTAFVSYPPAAFAPQSAPPGSNSSSPPLGNNGSFPANSMMQPVFLQPNGVIFPVFIQNANGQLVSHYLISTPAGPQTVQNHAQVLGPHLTGNMSSIPHLSGPAAGNVNNSGTNGGSAITTPAHVWEGQVAPAVQSWSDPNYYQSHQQGRSQNVGYPQHHFGSQQSHLQPNVHTSQENAVSAIHTSGSNTAPAHYVSASTVDAVPDLIKNLTLGKCSENQNTCVPSNTLHFNPVASLAAGYQVARNPSTKWERQETYIDGTSCQFDHSSSGQPVVNGKMFLQQLKEGKLSTANTTVHNPPVMCSIIDATTDAGNFSDQFSPPLDPVPSKDRFTAVDIEKDSSYNITSTIDRSRLTSNGSEKTRLGDYDSASIVTGTVSVPATSLDNMKPVSCVVDVQSGPLHEPGAKTIFSQSLLNQQPPTIPSLILPNNFPPASFMGQPQPNFAYHPDVVPPPTEPGLAAPTLINFPRLTTIAATEYSNANLSKAVETAPSNTTGVSVLPPSDTVNVSVHMTSMSGTSNVAATAASFSCRLPSMAQVSELVAKVRHRPPQSPRFAGCSSMHYCAPPGAGKARGRGRGAIPSQADPPQPGITVKGGAGRGMNRNRGSNSSVNTAGLHQEGGPKSTSAQESSSSVHLLELPDMPRDAQSASPVSSDVSSGGDHLEPLDYEEDV